MPYLKTIPKVSILVPAYNVAARLPSLSKAMESQSMPDWEMIIVDDCSSDDTLAVARRLAKGDSRIKVSGRRENSGSPMMPRLDACALASAPWIIPLDADDLISDNYLEAMLRRASETQADIVFPIMMNCRRVSSSGQGDESDLEGLSTGSPIFNEKLLNKDTVYPGRDLVIHTLYKWEFGCNGGLYRRELYAGALRSLMGLPIPEGTVPTMRPASSTPYIDEVGSRALLIAAPKVAFARDALYYYLFNPDSVVETPRSFYMGVEADLWLRLLIEKNYPEGSGTRRRLDLHCATHLVTLLGRFHRERVTMPPERRSEIRTILRNAWRRLPASSLQVLSPAYRLTLRTGPRLASLIFGLAGK